MATLNDFKDWFNELGLEESEYEHASNLVHSLRNQCECGIFNTQVAKGRNNGWIVSAEGVDDNLHLFTLAQITGFIRYIEYFFCEGMDVEIYCSYKHEMMKDY